MAKVVIKKRNDIPKTSHGLKFSDYHTTVDGIEISMLTDLKLNMSSSEVNSCSMTFLVDDVEVDAEFLASLKAHIQTKKECESNASHQ